MDNEEVRYSFEGDVSSLKAATDQAIKLLSKYEKAMQSSGKSEVSMQGFERIRGAVSVATKGIKALSSEIRKLSGSSGMSKASADASGLKSEVRETNSAISEQTSRLSAWSSGISSSISSILSKFSDMASKFDNMQSRMQSFKDSSFAASTVVRTKSTEVSEAFRRVSKSSDDSGKSASKFSTILGKMKDAFSKVSGAASTLGSKLASVTNFFNNLLNKVTSLTAELNKTTSAAKSLNNILKILAASKLGQSLANAVKESISYTENLNLFTVAMGDAVDIGTEFVEVMQEIYGMDPSSLMRYIGNFYQLSDAIGMPEEAATKMSLTLTKAINDISSLFNVDIETVFNDLSSGMQGMSRAVRKYGMDIRTTTLQQTALSLGITEQVETMSEANRQGLRFITMMKQASNASGDFARTIESPANQLRVFKEQMTQLGRAIGNFLIGPLSTVIVYLNALVSALRMVLTFVAGVIGIFKGFSASVDSSAAEDEADAIEGIGSAAGGAAKQMNKLLAPFDELNILQQEQASGGGGGGGIKDIMDPAIADAIADMELKLDNILMKAMKLRNAILEFLGFKVDFNEIISWDPDVLEKNLIEKFPQWTKTIQAVFDNWTDIVNGFKGVISALVNVFKKAKKIVLDFISIFINDDTVSNFINNLADNLNKLSSWINRNSDRLANIVAIFIALWSAIKVFKGVSKFIAPIVTFASKIISTFSGLPAVVKIIGGVAAAIALLYTNSNAFAESFKGLLSTIGTSFTEIFGAAWQAITTIWDSIERLWNNSLEPLFEQIGDALAPVLETISSLWEDVSTIVTSVFNTIAEVWTTVLEPVLSAFTTAIGNLATIFKSLWETVIGPIFTSIGSGLSTLWTETLLPILTNVITIIGSIMELILALWNNVLAPVINWLVETFGPLFESVFESIWNFIEPVVTEIGDLINSIMDVCQNVIDFLVGVFTGDWNKAWTAIGNVFVTVGNAIIAAFELVVNSIISLVNSLISLVYNAVVGLINAILGSIEWIAELLGWDLNIKIEAPPPQIGYVHIGRIDSITAPNTGGGGQTGGNGGGRYDNTSDFSSSAGSPPVEWDFGEGPNAPPSYPSQVTGGSTGDLNVKVVIGGKEWDSFIYESYNKGKESTGETPVNVGGGGSAIRGGGGRYD